jgi:hypothetical protein
MLRNQSVKVPAQPEQFNMLFSNLSSRFGNPTLCLTRPRLPLIRKSPLPVRSLLRNDLTQRIGEAVRQPRAAHTAVLLGE